MRSLVRLAVAAVFGGGLMALLGSASPAQAQDALAAQFCPAVPGAPAPRLINGMCFYNVGPVTQEQCPRGYGPVSFGPAAGCAGASSSFIATQALARTSEAITQAYTDLVNERIKRRRDQDRLSRLQQFAGAGRLQYAADLPGAKKPTVAVEAPAGPRPAVWVQAFGDFERREQTQVVSLAQRTQIIDNSTTSRTGGVVGGIDILLPGVLGADALLLGLTGGYADTTVKTRASQTEQKLGVASVGVYGAWILGNFSLGFNAKTDFVDMRQSFTDFLDSAPSRPSSAASASMARTTASAAPRATASTSAPAAGTSSPPSASTTPAAPTRTASASASPTAPPCAAAPAPSSAPPSPSPTRLPCSPPSASPPSATSASAATAAPPSPSTPPASSR